MSQSCRAKEGEQQQPAARWSFAEVTSPCTVVQPRALCFSMFPSHFGGVSSFQPWKLHMVRISLYKLTAELVQVLPHRKGLVVGSPCVRKAGRICIANSRISIRKKKRLQGTHPKQNFQPVLFFFFSTKVFLSSLWCSLMFILPKVQNKTRTFKGDNLYLTTNIKISYRQTGKIVLYFSKALNNEI